MQFLSNIRAWGGRITVRSLTVDGWRLAVDLTVGGWPIDRWPLEPKNIKLVKTSSLRASIIGQIRAPFSAAKFRMDSAITSRVFWVIRGIFKGITKSLCRRHSDPQSGI